MQDYTTNISLDREKSGKVRHRIYENFTEQDMINFLGILRDPSFRDNNEKFDYILTLLRNRGFLEIGAGTNRMAVKKGGYIFKIAFDTYGVKDNWQEFKMAPELQPYVTKAYECNGLVLVAEYVELMSQEEFINSKEIIRETLKQLEPNYLFSDMGTIKKNFCNYGYRQGSGEIVILDYGYIYPIDRKMMTCLKCAHELSWNFNFNELVCPNCGTKYDPIKIRDRMRNYDSTEVRYENASDNEMLTLDLDWSAED